MDTALLAQYLNLTTLVLVAGRLGGFVMFLPAFGGSSVPPQIRALLVIGLAALVTPLVGSPGSPPAGLLQLGLLLGAELALGAVVGIAIRVCFFGLQLGGQLLAQETGLAFAQIVDPANGAESDTLSVFYIQIAMMGFLLAGGHRQLVAATLDSFRTLPLLSAASVLDQGGALLLTALGLACELAVRIAAPTLLTLLLVNLALGFLSRTVPQLNVTMLGFTFKNLIAFLVIGATLPSMMDAFMGGLQTAATWVDRLLRTA